MVTVICLLRLLENARGEKYPKIYLGDDAEYFHKRHSKEGVYQEYHPHRGQNKPYKEDEKPME